MISEIMRICTTDLDELKDILLQHTPKESAAAILIGRNIIEGEIHYLARRVIPIPKEAYSDQSFAHIELKPSFIHNLVRLCEVNDLGLAICHSHPAIPGSLEYSKTDDFGETRIFEYFQKILPDKPFISLLLGSTDQFIGRVYKTPGQSPHTLDSIIKIGDTIEKIAISRKSVIHEALSQIHDRQILALGSAGQTLLASVKVGIVGVGGTGSAVAELITRMGIRDILLIDMDTVEKSNLSRMFGTFAASIPCLNWFKKKLYKTQIVQKHLKRINPDLYIRTIEKHLASKTNDTALLDRDIIFSCTDDHWGRSILNRISYQYLIPVINLGMRIDSDHGDLKGGSVVAQRIGPGIPCLWCHGYLSSDIIRAESLPTSEREDLAREGYVQGIGQATPSVISFTAMAAAMGVNLFLNLVTGLLGASSNPRRQVYDVIQGDLRRSTMSPIPECECSKYYAKGDSISLPFVDDHYVPIS